MPNPNLCARDEKAVENLRLGLPSNERLIYIDSLDKFPEGDKDCTLIIDEADTVILTAATELDARIY